MPEHARQQSIEWAIERVAWVFLYLLLAAIASGLLGQGPLADSTLKGPTGAVEMEFKRFMTNKSPAALRVTLPPSTGPARVVLDRGYLARVRIEGIVPEPEKVIAEGEGLAFVFSADSAQPFQVHFFFEARQAGRLEGWVSVAGGPRRAFSQFVYP